MYLSGSSKTGPFALVKGSGVVECEDDRVSMGMDATLGLDVVGLVPDLFRSSGWVAEEYETGVGLSWAADIEGLNLRGVVEPVNGRGVRTESSPLADGATDSFCDLLSDEVP